MKQPCKKDCEGRSGECHATCEKWKAWEEWKFKHYEDEHFEKDINGFLGMMEKERIKNIRLGKLNSRKKFSKSKNNY